MVALLQSTGVRANKQAGKNATYSITVSSRTFSQAVEILKASGYPRKPIQNIGEIFKKEGFVSSPLEERARLNFAQSQELTQTIESIDGVVVARVHLALPEQDPLEEAKKAASASVFVKYLRGTDLGKREAQIKALLVNSIEDLPYENVTVVLFPAERPPNLTTLQDQGNPYLIRILLGALVLLFCIILLMAWFFWHKYSQAINKKGRLEILNSDIKGEAKWLQRKI